MRCFIVCGDAMGNLEQGEAELCKGHAIWYRVMESGTKSWNLLESNAIWYRVTQSGKESCNLLESHAIWHRVMQYATGWCKFHTALCNYDHKKGQQSVKVMKSNLCSCI